LSVDWFLTAVGCNIDIALARTSQSSWEDATDLCYNSSR